MRAKGSSVKVSLLISASLSALSVWLGIHQGLSGVDWVVVALAFAVSMPLAYLGLTNRSATSVAGESELVQRAWLDAQAKQEEVNNKLVGLSTSWCPTVGSQLDCANAQMKGGIEGLSVAFSHIHKLLENTVEHANTAVGVIGQASQGQSSVTLSAQAKLQSVLSEIQSAFMQKASLMDQLKDFISSTNELQKMTSSVEYLAARTNLLALNASIEAARAGPEGRGFAVVAEEVRKLSFQSAETGQSIRNRVVEISKAATQAGQGAALMEESDKALLENASRTLNSVIEGFQAVTTPLHKASNAIVDSSVAIRNELDSAIVHFQFQDRVSQILSHVQASVGLFAAQAAMGGAGLAPQALMADLEKGYTMAEERQNHGTKPGQVQSGEQAMATNAADDVTFF